MHLTKANLALQKLIEGNARFIANQKTRLDFTFDRAASAKHPEPFAAILGCVDSRVPPELVFDQGLDDLFVIRTAGHVLDNAVLGSLEYGVVKLHIPLIVVLGHERCGAVKATLDALKHQTEYTTKLQHLIDAIRPAVEASQRRGEGDPVENAVRANIEFTLHRLTHLPFFAKEIKQGRLKIVGMRYDLDDGAIVSLVRENGGFGMADGGPHAQIRGISPNSIVGRIYDE